MSLGPFLWRYFRRYGHWALLSVATTAVFAVATVALLALFRPILSEVLLADQRAGLVADLALPGGETGEGSETLGIELDLAGFFARVIERLQATLGINQHNVVWFLPLTFAAVFLIRGLASFLNGYLFQLMGLGATNDLRNDLYQRILRQSSRFYSRHPSGELVSRVGNDVAVIQNAVSMRLLDLFQQSVTLVLLLWYLLSTHFRLAVVCLVIVPAVVYPIVRFGKGMRGASRRSQERLADLANLVAEVVRGHRVVKAFGMEGFELARFRAATRRHLRVMLKAQLLNYASGPVVETLAAVGAAGFIIYAGYTVRSGELRPSEVVTFLTNLILLYDPVRKLNRVNMILQGALAAAQRIAHVMAIPNEVEEIPTARKPAAPPSSWSQIRFEKVVFSYDGHVVLHGIDLCIQRGEVVALVGPSGAGKSTLVNLLPRFFDPDRGRVTLGDCDLREMSLAGLRSLIGLVTQDTILFNDTVRNNIAYGRSDLSLKRVREAARAAYADDFIAQLPAGYDTVVGEGGLRLSGGQRQRLAIARALLKDPPILILDEATSQLDSESEALVKKALYNLVAGRTALVIAHRLSTVTAADRILVMEGGRVVEEGTHEELLRASGTYLRMHELQSGRQDSESRG